MDYKRIYQNIIYVARRRPEIIGYFERHHILPSSLGGGDDNINIVKLTAREHFICHLLLTKIYLKDTVEYFKMLRAFLMMAQCKRFNQARHITSISYEKKKIEFARLQSLNQTGYKNNSYGTIWVHNPLLKISKKTKSR